MAISDNVRYSTDEVIDLRNEFGIPAKGEFVQFNGIHLNVEGQKTMTVAIINNFIKRK